MKYKVIIPNWVSGLNELLNHQEKRWDARLKKMRVYNTEKVKNEKLIRQCLAKQGMKILKNDGWNDIVKISFDYDIDRGDPRAEITITEL